MNRITPIMMISKKVNKIIALYLIAQCFAIWGSAQNPRTEFIFETHLQSGALRSSLISSARDGETLPPFTLEKISQNFEIYTISVEKIDSAFWRDHLEKHPSVYHITPNLTWEKRATPNDTRIAEQWHLGVIKAFEAWDITTGGKDKAGREIVIAVLDDGYDLEHEDLKANFRINNAEIPDDGIDNDNNGYIDDYRGWNTRTKNDKIENRSHGTNVVGVLGAVGNNGKGVSGINWNVKMLPIAIGTQISDIIQGFDYVITQRRRFNTSNGAAGAFIVATNYSGGLPNAFAKDFPVWCNMYDRLGAEGIINVGATTNEDADVEVKGDMPSTCESNYLIIATSTDRTDEKEKIVGYGAKSVDLAAPGERILTTDTAVRGFYRTESGTSLSAPMVAGAVGLLYAAGCTPFEALSKSRPHEAALKVKEIILNSVDIRPSLVGKTVTGGRLNLFNALVWLTEAYDGCVAIPAPVGKLSILDAYQTGNNLFINYLTPDDQDVYLRIVDSRGQRIYEQVLTPPIFGLKQLNIPFIPAVPGIYFISMISGKNVASKKFYARIP